ncbi:MAG: hypothetical protein J6J03_08770, partial [Tyzzerella sp.]|nr:hypothetical protein [Tyzzerella sp.]
ESRRIIYMAKFDKEVDGMPFVQVKISEAIEQKCKESESFRTAWEESREEYRLIGEMVSLRKSQKFRGIFGTLTFVRAPYFLCTYNIKFYFPGELRILRYFFGVILLYFLNTFTK